MKSIPCEPHALASGHLSNSLASGCEPHALLASGHDHSPTSSSLCCDNLHNAPHVLREHSDAFEDASNVLVTVLMPCLNEARTVGACIEAAHLGCQAALAALNPGRSAIAGSASEASSSILSQPYTYEIVIADNGSTDGSAEIAVEHGARVVQVTQKGYGAALLGGIAAARGKYIVMGDSDCSYDFGEVPRFLDKLEEGYDLVMGNRFAGGIMPGAMPWHHRYIGNPLLSGLGQLFYRTSCSDWHCGLRAFDKQKITSLNLSCVGMEFASEMLLRASQKGRRMAEIPITLHPDARNRAPHLSSVRDGLRHLVILFCSFPRVRIQINGEC